MRPLIFIQKMLTRLSIHPADENTTKWQRRAYICLNAVVINILIAACVSNAAYFWKFYTIQLEEAILALFSFFAMFGLFYTFSVSFLQRMKIKNIFDQLTDIYNASKNSQISSC